MFKITILLDNTTIIDKYLFSEPALSLLIETESKKILFDTGYCDIFLKNASLLNKTLADIDYLILSHGHNDHTGGLAYLLPILKEGKNKPKLIAAEGVFEKRYDKTDGEFGCPVEVSEIEKVFDIIYAKTPLEITDAIIFLGTIPRFTDFENQTPVGLIKETDEDDYVKDDSALVLKTAKGLVILTGCSHSGIVNIIEYAKKITGIDKIASIIGGLHLREADDSKIDKTVEYIKNLNLESLYCCHCTGLKAQSKLYFASNLKETGSGLEIYF